MYLIFYGSITFVIVIFLGSFTYVFYLFLGNKKETATERENSYVPTHAVNQELNCNFLSAYKVSVRGVDWGIFSYKKGEKMRAPFQISFPPPVFSLPVRQQ